jgi:hypothetical protein
MRVYDLVSLTNPGPIWDARCSPGGEGRRKFGGRAIADKTPKKASKDAGKGGAVKTGPTVKVASTDGPTYFLSSADIYYGPVTISSRKYNIKYRTGFMQYVDWYTADANDPDSVLTASQAAGKHAVQPFTYNLQMLKPQESY